MRDIIERVLREQGLDDNGASPHGWRCQHPDRFPDYCTCVSDAVQAIAAELEAAGYRMTSIEPSQDGRSCIDCGEPEQWPNHTDGSET